MPPRPVVNVPRNAPRTGVMIATLLFAAMFRLLLIFILLLTDKVHPQWMQDGAFYILTEPRRHHLVFAIRFCSTCLALFAMAMAAGFNWEEVEWEVFWGPEALRDGAFWSRSGESASRNEETPWIGRRSLESLAVAWS